VPYSPWPGAAPTHLILRWEHAGHQPSPEVHHVIDMLSGEFASALTRIDLHDRLESAARTDTLSGLPNRRAWDDELPQQLARARRFGYDLCVALLDLDGLKVLNDAQGHLAGDALLRATARAWSAELRAVDFLVRWGGDEFALILPGCALEDATATLERMRSVMPDGARTSAGLACWDGVESDAALVARADEALYEAKRAGRDRLVLAPAGSKAS
jgi:diguanylate cyclase (GGDEF)-like protein